MDVTLSKSLYVDLMFLGMYCDILPNCLLSLIAEAVSFTQARKMRSLFWVPQILLIFPPRSIKTRSALIFFLTTF